MYYVHSNGKQSGPITEAEVLAALASGQLSPNDLGITQGGTEWKSLGEMYQSASQGLIANTASPGPTVPPRTKSRLRRLIGGLLLVIGFLFLFGFGSTAIYSYFEAEKAEDLYEKCRRDGKERFCKGYGLYEWKGQLEWSVPLSITGLVGAGVGFLLRRKR